MVELRRPGLYVERAPVPPPPAPLRSDVAAFVGRARRGPVGCSLRVEGWREFQRFFGGIEAQSHLSYAVRGYFENGGQIAHVLRVGREAGDAQLATQSPFVRSVGGIKVNAIAVHAASAGAWSNGMRTYFAIRRLSIGSPPQLAIRVEPPEEPDEFIGPFSLDPQALAGEPGDPQIDPLIRAVANRSQFIRVDAVLTDVLSANSIRTTSRLDWRVDLSGGSDGVVDADLYDTAITTICDQPEPAILAFPDLGLDVAPDRQVEVIQTAIAKSEELKDRIVVVEVPAAGDVFEHPPLDPDVTLAWVNQLRSPDVAGGARSGAFYHPWLRVRDPLGGVAMPLRDVPPCGHVAGVISRSDRDRGASYTPANLPMYDAVDVSRSYVEEVESELNRLGINIIRCVPGAGVKVWGGGTLARSGPGDSPENRFVAHRRLINRLVRAIRRVAEPLVFDSNGPELWLTLFRGINSVLFEAFQHGALKGNKPEDGYRVRCDATINTPDVVDRGQVLCEIDVAPAAPMEYILLRLAFAGDGQLEVFES